MLRGNNISRATCANTFSYRKLICCNSNNLPLERERERGANRSYTLHDFISSVLSSKCCSNFVRFVSSKFTAKWMNVSISTLATWIVCPPEKPNSKAKTISSPGRGRGRGKEGQGTMSTSTWRQQVTRRSLMHVSV